jgi:Zn-dependent M28 family amino/carboxypeptidase
MTRSLFVGLCVAAVLTLSSVAAAQSVQDIVNQVSQGSYTDFLDNSLYTHTGDDRGWGAEHDLAQTNIYNAFVGDGLTASLHAFSYSGDTYYNVVGVLPGAVHPDNIFIVGAHYDSVSNPGADDNASGAAGVMEAARVLSQYSFEATLIFIAFDREEQGLIGSNAYATDHAGDNILGMISLDMIAYNYLGGNAADIYGRAASDPVKNALADAVALYGGGITTTLNGAFDASDHAPFEWQGFDACLLIEEWGNPYYHQQADTVDTPNYIDYAFATNMVRGTVGYLATAAVLVPEPGTVVLVALGLLALVRRKR